MLVAVGMLSMAALVAFLLLALAAMVVIDRWL